MKNKSLKEKQKENFTKLKTQNYMHIKFKTMKHNMHIFFLILFIPKIM